MHVVCLVAQLKYHQLQRQRGSAAAVHNCTRRPVLPQKLYQHQVFFCSPKPTTMFNGCRLLILTDPSTRDLANFCWQTCCNLTSLEACLQVLSWYFDQSGLTSFPPLGLMTATLPARDLKVTPYPRPATLSPDFLLLGTLVVHVHQSRCRHMRL